LIAYLLFNNFSVSTLSQNSPRWCSHFKVTPALVLKGLIIAVVIGMIGWLPAGDPRGTRAGGRRRCAKAEYDRTLPFKGGFGFGGC
jgi:hypothetical protein